MLCIPKELRSKFVNAIKNGDLDIDKLADEKDSNVRRAEFEKVLGSDYGKAANTLFENGLMAKDQEAGMIRAIKAIGLPEKAQADFISKISGMDRLLSPKEEEAVLQDAREQKLGIAITDDQAKTLQTLAKRMDALNPENRGDVKNLDDLISSMEKLPNLTDEQKADIAGIKDSLNKPQSPDEASQKIRVKIASGDTEIGKETQDLARSFVAQGITDPDKLVDAVHEVLKKSIPDITRRETMDTISGYGEYRQLSKDETDAKLRDLKGQMQNLSKLEDMRQGEAPLKSGAERAKPSDEQRRLIQQVNEAKKAGGYDVKDPETQLKTALDSVKTQLKHQISDFEKQIETGEKIVKEKRTVTMDKEATDLKARRDDLKSQFDEIFGKKPLTDDQRIAMASRALDKAISNIESDLKEGKLFPDKKVSATPVTPELEAKRATLDALKAQRQELRDIANPKATPEERSLSAYKSRTASKIAELQAKIDSGDFSQTTRAQKPRIFDDEAANLKADLERVKGVIKDAQRKNVLEDRQLTKDAVGRFQRLISKQYGKDVPPEVQAKIDELKSLYQSEDMQTKTLGTSREFIQAQHDFSDYVNGLNDTPAWKSIRDDLSKIFKNSFIAVKTGVKTFLTTAPGTALEAITRRLSNTKVLGDVDLSKKAAWAMENVKLGLQTGENSAMMLDGKPNSVFGENKQHYSEDFGSKTNVRPGETVGGKVLEKVAQGLNLITRGQKIVTIDLLHKAPQLFTSTMNMADSLDILSSAVAKLPGVNMSANEIFDDAGQVKPQTDYGKIVRNRAQQDMFRVLGVNNSKLAEITTNLQRDINKAVPTLGNYLLPMAKQPSNIISNQIENSGGGFLTGLLDFNKGKAALDSLKEQSSEATPDGVDAVLQMRNGINTLVRTAGTLAAAYYLTHNLKGTSKDFTTDLYGNSYVKMGNNWLSTNVFGSLGTAVAGIMMAKAGHNGFIYPKAAVVAGENSPVASDIVSAGRTVATALSKGQNPLQIGVNAIKSYLDPILVQDIEKSKQQDSLNPLLVGTLIRTQQQVTDDKKASTAKSAATRKATKAKSSP